MLWEALGSFGEALGGFGKREREKEKGRKRERETARKREREKERKGGREKEEREKGKEKEKREKEKEKEKREREREGEREREKERGREINTVVGGIEETKASAKGATVEWHLLMGRYHCLCQLWVVCYALPQKKSAVTIAVVAIA